MARRHNRAYEYEYAYHSEHKHRRERNPRLRLLDTGLFILVILLPLVGLVMYFLDIPLPVLLLSGYSTVVLIVAGLLFLILTASGVGGFGKVGYCFSHTRGKRWMTPAEAKGNTYLFGFILLILGLLCGLLTLKILGAF